MEKMFQRTDINYRDVVKSRTFDFIHNTYLKKLLQRDYGYAKNCLRYKLWKPTIILYGSLIEAILRENTKTDKFAEALEKSFKINLITEKQRASQLLSLPLQQYLTSDDTIIEIEYPVLNFPQKVKSIDLEKIPIIEAKLSGIKGQYLMFDNDHVINVRKYSGYFLKISY